jgi:type VI secretion system secreted protein Hcp
MDGDLFIKIEGIEGESVDLKHKGEIQLISFSWGMTQSGTTHSNTGGGSARVSVQDLSFVHYVDKATPNIVKACCNGRHISSALLTVRKAGGTDPVEYVKIKMSDLIVSSVTTGIGPGEQRITETVTLNFAKFNYDYTPQNEKGLPAPAVSMGWDIAGNGEL